MATTLMVQYPDGSYKPAAITDDGKLKLGA